MKKIVLFIICFTSITSLRTTAQSCVGQAGQVQWNLWLNFPSFPDSTDLAAMESYPENPDLQVTLGSLSTPVNYNDYYASMIRGYITVPQTGQYYFNITGDDDVQFYLSTDESRHNLRKRAEVITWTNVGEHNKEPNQTSQLLSLTAGQNYYFEIHQFEGCCGDHMNLYFRRPGNPDTQITWQIVDYQYIKDYACQTNCPPRGTACDDGDPATSDDRQDGFCNCVGVSAPPTACIGERGKVEAYYFDNLPGNYVENDLINSPKFPLLPDRKELLKGAYGPLSPYTKEQYGTLVQGYLTVPVTGQYSFNITGDNQTFFYLSSNHDIANKQSHQALVMYGLGEAEHNSSSFQTIGPLTLEKGKYYYFEFRHKENTWRDFFYLHWKTPFHSSWKLVPSFYLFDYDCELSCVAQGTPCDDGNIYTNNDQYDASCNCVGTPCSGPDCNDTLAHYVFYEPAARSFTNLTTVANSWQSCSTSLPNPNPARGSATHWIKYDFSSKYRFKGSRVWNYNVLNETDKGMRQVVVDYSDDGITWTPMGGTYAWPQAPGNSDYGGFIGPNFNDQKARYILITALNNHGDPLCTGFSDITFDAVHCDDKDTPCDDDDPLTSYDKFDSDCNCRGTDIHCASDTIELARVTLQDPSFGAIMRIESKSSVPSTQNISFTAGNSIVLLPGFEVQSEGVFKAEIANCIQAAFEENQQLSLLAKKKDPSFVSNNEENTRIKEVFFRLNQPGQVKLLLLDAKGSVLVTLIDEHYDILGTHRKYIPTGKLKKGTYVVELQINESTLKESFVVED